LESLLDYVRPGDVVVVIRLDRWVRSTRDLLDIAEHLRLSNVGLRGLAKPWTPIRRRPLTAWCLPCLRGLPSSSDR